MHFMLTTHNYTERAAQLSFLNYSDGNPCLRIIGTDGNVLLTATTNVEGWRPFNESQVLIKDWSENEGLLDCLEREGIVKRTGVEIRTGFVKAIECELQQGWRIT